MARTARKVDDVEEVKAMDFDLAQKLYKQDILPARSKAAEHMQEQSTAFKAVKKQAHIQPSAMKAAIKVVEMEDAKREDWLRGFNGMLAKNGVDPNPKDMVDQMQADDGYARPKLVTVGKPYEGDDADLAGDEPDEA